MALAVQPGLLLRIDGDNNKSGWLSGAALKAPVRVSIFRRSTNGDALVTDRFQYWMVKGSCIVYSEADAGRKRLEIMRAIYGLVLKGEFAEAKKTFFDMHRLLL